MNSVLMEDMEAMIHLFGVSHVCYRYLVRNIDIQGVYLFTSVVNKNRNQSGPAPPVITGQKRLC